MIRQFWMVAGLLVATSVFAKEIVVDESSADCRLEGNWADNQGDNPEGKTFSSGGTVGGVYHYTSKHGRWKRTGREKAIFTPNLPKAGTYKVEVSWRASENRSPRVSWEVKHAQGKKTATVNQRGDGLVWHNLGTFNFEAGRKGYVAMVNDGGESACVDAARFTLVKASSGPVNPGPGDGDSGDNMDDVVGTKPDDGGAGGKAPEGEPTAVLKPRPGKDDEHTAHHDATVEVEIGLMTYGKARARVSIIAADGTEREWLSWERADDKDPATLLADGRPVADSIFEQGPGDPSAQVVTQTTRIKAGDKVVASLKGRFGKAKPVLKVKIFE